MSYVFLIVWGFLTVDACQTLPHNMYNYLINKKFRTLQIYFKQLSKVQLLKPCHTRSKCLHKHRSYANLFDVYEGGH